MNPSYYQNQINKIEKDIADLHKKIADESKKENGKIKQIELVNKSKLKKDHFELINQLKKGEQSGFIKNFDRKVFLKKFHEKYLSK